MRAMRMHAYGDPSVIRMDEVPEPVPRDGEVLLRVAASAFNPSDAGLRRGLLRAVFPIGLPYTMGLDVSGTTEDGRRVIGLLDSGAAADYAVAPLDRLADAPATIPLEHAAAIPIAGGTAWQAVHDHGRVETGQRVLVIGAGAVGGFASQLARHAGAEVTVLSGRAEVAPDGPFDVLLNCAPIPAERLAVLGGGLRPGGRLVSAATPVAGHFVLRHDSGQLGELVRLIDAGAVRVDAVVRPLDELAAVHREAEAGRLTGKTVVAPPPG